MPELFNCLLSLIQDKLRPVAPGHNHACPRPGTLTYFPQLTALWQGGHRGGHTLHTILSQPITNNNDAFHQLPNQQLQQVAPPGESVSEEKKKQQEKQLLLDSHLLPSEVENADATECHLASDVCHKPLSNSTEAIPASPAIHKPSIPLAEPE